MAEQSCNTNGTGLNISNNSQYGLLIAGGCDNTLLYENTFINNHQGLVQACDNGSGTQTSYSSVGNFWSDYEVRYPAATNDGNTWDVPYNFDGTALSSDNYPLVDPIKLGPELLIITSTDTSRAR